MNPLIWPSNVRVRRWIHKNTITDNNMSHKSEYSPSSPGDNRSEQSTNSPLSNANTSAEVDATDKSSEQTNITFHTNGQSK